MYLTEVLKIFFIYKNCLFSDCSGLLNTASTRPTTITNVSTDTTKTTTQTTTASEEYLPSNCVKYTTRYNH